MPSARPRKDFLVRLAKAEDEIRRLKLKTYGESAPVGGGGAAGLPGVTLFRTSNLTVTGGGSSEFNIQSFLPFQDDWALDGSSDVTYAAGPTEVDLATSGWWQFYASAYIQCASPGDFYAQLSIPIFLGADQRITPMARVKMVTASAGLLFARIHAISEPLYVPTPVSGNSFASVALGTVAAPGGVAPAFTVLGGTRSDGSPTDSAARLSARKLAEL